MSTTEAPAAADPVAPPKAPSAEKVCVCLLPWFDDCFLSNLSYLCTLSLQTAPAAAAAAAAAKKRSPSDFLKSVLGRPVRVKLNSGTEYRGTYRVDLKYRACS